MRRLINWLAESDAANDVLTVVIFLLIASLPFAYAFAVIWSGK